MKFINNKKDLEALLDSISNITSANDDQIPHFYLDLEGHKVSRNGTLTLLIIMLHPQMDTYIIDVITLGRATFDTKNSRGMQDLKSVLESDDICKVFFDVRRDSDALFAHFGVRLAGVHDLQLMELAARPKRMPKFLAGLPKCVTLDAGLSKAEAREVAEMEKDGIQIFDSTRAAVSDVRPLGEEIKVHCVQDVQFMPKLWSVYRGRMSEFWWNEVLKETKARIQKSQEKNWRPRGIEMALAPEHWAELGSSSKQENAKVLE